MEFLDTPIVKALLWSAAIVTLVSWLFGRHLPFFDKGTSEARELELEALINQLSEAERWEIQNSIDGQRKLEAIKFLRVATNAGLRDAKDTVEHMIRLSNSLSEQDDEGSNST